MRRLGRFQLVRKIAICSVVLAFSTTTVETASAKKPKPARNNPASVPSASPGSSLTDRPAAEGSAGPDFRSQWTTPSAQTWAPGVTNFPVTPTSALQPFSVVDAVPPSPMPDGEWSRKLGPLEQELVVGPNSLRAKVDLSEGGEQLIVHLAADYSVTSDGLVYGVLTDVRLETSSPNLDSNDDIAELVVLQNRFVDQPFSLRWRVVNDALVVKDVKFAGSGLADDDEDYAAIAKLYIAGSFRRSNSAPAAKP